MLRQPPSSTLTDPLLPYATLFRSVHQRQRVAMGVDAVGQRVHMRLPPFRAGRAPDVRNAAACRQDRAVDIDGVGIGEGRQRLFGEGSTAEHPSDLQSLMRISYAVFCLHNKTHVPTELRE